MAVLTSNYPTSLDTTTTLGEVSNRAKTTLAVALASSGETQISLTDASAFPNSGAVSIDNEIFYYSSKSTNVLTIESRANQGTSAAAHSGGALVYLRLTKGHYEVLRTAIIALETKLGTGATITSVGTISSGTWQGSVISSTYGGTGVNNAGRTLTINTNSGTLAFGNASKTVTFNNSITFAGTDGTTMTFPSTSATIARTDAANTFTGHQTIEGVTATGATGTGNMVYDSSPTLITPSFTTTGTLTRNSLGVTAADGWVLQNTTAATNSVQQQYSPRIRFTGSGWKTNATAASQTVDFIQELQPVQGSANPTGNYIISAQVNAGGYLPLFSLNSDGDVIFKDKFGVSNLIYSSSSGSFTFNSTRYVTITDLRVLTNANIEAIYGSTYTTTKLDLNVAGETLKITDSTNKAILLNLVSTASTAQLKVGYDASNYWSAKVDSAGTVSFSTVGSSGGYLFSGGILRAGTAPTTLTDSAGKILSAALNTVAVAQGGTGGTSASITLFNNITGYSASGATGTTSTNLVFSTSPTLTTPAITTSSTLTNNLAANTSGDGFILQNTSTASSGNQMYSPRVRFVGQGWKTNATAASQTVEYIEELQTVQGTANPSGVLYWRTQINGGGYTARMSLTTDGVLALVGAALTPSTASTYAFSATNSGANDVTIGSDGTYGYIQSWNAKPLYLNNQGNNIIMGATTSNVGIGSGAVSAKVHITSTAEQLRVGYDASNYYKTTVSSTGGVTWDAVGSGASFTFADKIISTVSATNTGLDLATSDAYAEMRVIRNSVNATDKDMHFGYQSGATSALHLYSNNTETLTVSGVKVGVAMTPSQANGILQVAGDIGVYSTTGTIRPASNSDSYYLKFMGTSLVVGGLNSYAYNYSGGGLLASLSDGGSVLIMDVGSATSTGHRLKLTNDGTGQSGTLTLSTSSLTTFYANSSSGHVAIGHASPSARLHVIRTAEQLRVGYDTSNYYKTTVGSTGGVTFDAVGSGSAFTFSDKVNVVLTNNALGLDVGNTVGNVWAEFTTASRANRYAEIQAIAYGLTLAIDPANAFGGNGIFTVTNGKFSVGANSYALFSVNGTPTSFDGVYVNAALMSTEAYSSNSRTGIGFGGYYNGTPSTSSWAAIQAIKENTTSGNYAGALLFYTRTNGVGTLSERLRIDSTGNVGIGTSGTISAFLHVLGTTEQMRIGYDASNYYKTTVSSSGGVTFDAVGSGAAFTFSDPVNFLASTSTSGIRIGSLEIQGYATNNSIIADNAYYNGGWTYRATGTVVFAQLTNAQFQVYNAVSGTGGTGFTPFLRFQTDATGMVYNQSVSGTQAEFRADSASNSNAQVFSFYSGNAMRAAITMSSSDDNLVFRNASSVGGRSVYGFVFLNDSATVMKINNTGDMGVGTGTGTISARMHLIKTTEQLRVGYDTSNYYTTTVSSAGAVTFDAVGSSAGFTFSDAISSTRINPRVGTTSSSSTPTPNADTDDLYTVTALAAGATFGSPSGTPVNGQKMMIRIKDNGTARSLAWNAIYRAIGITLPSTTTVSKTTYVGLIYNSADSKWDAIATGTEA